MWNLARVVIKNKFCEIRPFTSSIVGERGVVQTIKLWTYKNGNAREIYKNYEKFKLIFRVIFINFEIKNILIIENKRLEVRPLSIVPSFANKPLLLSNRIGNDSFSRRRRRQIKKRKVWLPAYDVDFNTNRVYEVNKDLKDNYWIKCCVYSELVNIRSSINKQLNSTRKEWCLICSYSLVRSFCFCLGIKNISRDKE